MAVTVTERPRSRAVLRNYGASASKVREVLGIIRGKPVEQAIRELSLVSRGPAEAVGKLLASAVANATVQHGLGVSDMVVRLAYADEGTTLKRFRPRARGRATRIRKRTCHITVVVEEMTLEERQRAVAQTGRRAVSRQRRVQSSRRGRQQAQATSAEATSAEVATSQPEITSEAAASEQTVEVTAAEEQVAALVATGEETGAETPSAASEEAAEGGEE
ncbi:ribosomal protein L22 [Acidimicrobium ferrooxidans DSM 10331]|uniref:Large ribosomal subunit protein uL22 n=1 Tax=Acidimicrobium ferrooxidans (strain DSM 10331 / JCM 15462 / NBRC 103882 / ICP) TaxID=525909 RepID=C7M2X7_ACIFD|nr:ribosomal protein L22 [Acidimicrobium ferrooxidans DSM 10331]